MTIIRDGHALIAAKAVAARSATSTDTDTITLETEWEQDLWHAVYLAPSQPWPPGREGWSLAADYADAAVEFCRERFPSGDVFIAAKAEVPSEPGARVACPSRAALIEAAKRCRKLVRAIEPTVPMHPEQLPDLYLCLAREMAMAFAGVEDDESTDHLTLDMLVGRCTPGDATGQGVLGYHLQRALASLLPSGSGELRSDREGREAVEVAPDSWQPHPPKVETTPDAVAAALAEALPRTTSIFNVELVQSTSGCTARARIGMSPHAQREITGLGETLPEAIVALCNEIGLNS